MDGDRRALVVATYAYDDDGLSRLTSPGHDAEAFAAVLRDPEIAGFDVEVLLNQPTHVVAEAVDEFYAAGRSRDLTLLYFSGHGLKDDDGRLYLAMRNTRRPRLRSTGLAATQVREAMDSSSSRRNVLVLDCCYSGAFPAGRTAKADQGVDTLERFHGKGRAVLTASDATQYAFEGDHLQGAAPASVFTRYLVEAIRTGAADLDEDGDIALDELYRYVRDRVVAEQPQQRPKKQEEVDGQIVLARNVHWTMPLHVRHAIDSPDAVQRLHAVTLLENLHRVGNDIVRAAVREEVAVLAEDDSRKVSSAAGELLERIVDVPATVAPAGRGTIRGTVAGREAEPLEAPPPHIEPTGALPAARRSPSEADQAREERRADERPRRWEAEQEELQQRLRREVERGGAIASGPTEARVLLALVVAGLGGVIASRFLTFVVDYVVVDRHEYSAAEAGWPTLATALGMGLPLALAALLLVVRADSRPAVALADGLVVGAALTLTHQLGREIAYWVVYDFLLTTGFGVLVTAWVLVTAAAVLALRRTLAGARPPVGGSLHRICGLVAVGCLIAGFVLSRDEFDYGFSLLRAAPAIDWAVLAVVALPLTLLLLNGVQRITGLTAVTVLGAWLGYFAYDRVWHDAEMWQQALVAALCIVACYVAQLGGRRSSRPVGDLRRPHD